jgi:hypothetical protein
MTDTYTPEQQEEYEEAYAFLAQALKDAEPIKHVTNAQGRRVGPNPFREVLKELYAKGEGHRLVIPSEALKRTIGLARKAAHDEGIGLDVRHFDQGNGTHRVEMKPRDKRVRTPKPELVHHEVAEDAEDE